MDARALSALELPRVLTYLAGFTVSEAGFTAALALRPLADTQAIRREAAFFEQGRLWLMRAEAALHPFSPLDGLLQYLETPAAVLDLDGFWGLKQVLIQAGNLCRSVLDQKENDLWPLWTEYCAGLFLPVKSISALSRCLSDEGQIKDEASPELSLVRGELRRLHQHCIRKVKDYAAEYNIMHFLQDSFVTLSSDRYVLPLKANFRGRLQGVIHDYSQTGETCYFEPLFLVELNNRLQELKREEREEERKILIYLSGLAREELSGIRGAYAFLVRVDLLQARAALGDCYDGRMVDFDQGRGVLLRDAKHPLLALATSQNGKKAYTRYRIITAAGEGGVPAKDAASASAGSDAGPARERAVVPSTLELLPDQHALVISGGNAGGKTVCLKTLGLTAVMGMCVLPVPVAPGSVLPPWRQIHAFIGDEQSLEDHVSTFTAQITHLARIWPGIGTDSLVILDEFGAGTDPSQGAALAQAVLDAILEKRGFVVAATHFPALKAYALSAPGVRVASVLFDPKTKRPLFRLVYDQVGASQALDVAREHGLPEDVLKRAEKYLLLSGEDSSALVERLNALAVAREGELQALGAERAAFRQKKKEIKERFERERERLFTRVQDEARQVLDQWKASRISHKQALKELSRVRRELAGTEADPAGKSADAPRRVMDVSELTVRQKVRHVPWKRAGVVLEIDGRKNRVRMDLDGGSLWADIADIAPLEGSGTAGSGKGGAAVAVGVTGNSSGIVPLRLDLRGMRADVALSELERFLDRAVLSGREILEVIHGRGTGVLRRELHGYLRGNALVGSFRLASEGEGGDGVTIVELK